MDRDLGIARKAKLEHIKTIAARLGIPAKFLENYGNYKAKVSLEILKRTTQYARRTTSKYIVVTGITPTHLGEGKTVTTIGLSMALNKAGKSAVACIREPSLGPFFGIKGGGVGGGRSQVLPGEDINLHLTGDIHAVSAAHNLCSAFLDNHLYRGNKLDIDLKKIFWKRVIDVNDRSLRSIKIGVGGGEYGVARDSSFEITAASEVMAILALADSIPDLRERVSKIVVALTRGGKPVTAEDLKVAGAMAVLLKDALKPNLLQTIENTPCFIHTGPFANITHGNSSILADKMGLGLADYVVTEAGFGADCGLEKFVNIKCRQSGLKPSAVVLVCSIRALKIHSGMYRTAIGKPLSRELDRENVDAVDAGCGNLVKQIENVRLFDVPCVVAINRFLNDTEREIKVVRDKALQAGAFNCVTSELYRYGSRGGEALAKSVVQATSINSRFRYLYEHDEPIKDKISKIAVQIYGAKGVSYEKEAEENIAHYQKLGYGKLPICMAKTPLSLSHDPALKGAPTGFVLPVRDVRPSIGAGFLYALCGKILTMPGLPSNPIGERIDINPKGEIRYVSK